MNARVKPCIDLASAYELTRLAYPKGWRLPPANEIDQQRAAEAAEDRRREDSELDTEI